MRVYSPMPLDAVDYHARGDGYSDVRLRKGFETVTRSTDDGETMEYSAEELYFVTLLPKQEVVDSFDALWTEVEREQMSDDERIAKLERANTDLELALCDVYESMAGVV